MRITQHFDKPVQMANFLNGFGSGRITSIALSGYAPRTIQLGVQYDNTDPDGDIQFRHKEGFSSRSEAEDFLSTYPYVIALTAIGKWHGRGWVVLWGYCRNAPRKVGVSSLPLDSRRYRGCDKQVAEQRKRAASRAKKEKPVVLPIEDNIETEESDDGTECSSH